MDNIVDPNNEFDFSQLSLGIPSGIQGGAYFTKLLYFQKPLYIQTPKSLTKQGFVKNVKKYYTELMFDNNDERFFHWLENLETRCHQLIYEKRETWFQNQLELSDIESAFATTLRPYRSCKYNLLRVNLKMNYSTSLPVVKIYNESETMLSIDDVTSDTNIISIVEFQGIKFTSRNFQIEMELKQMMTLNTEILFENCLIKAGTNRSVEKTSIENGNYNLETNSVKSIVLEEISNFDLDDTREKEKEKEKEQEERERKDGEAEKKEEEREDLEEEKKEDLEEEKERTEINYKNESIDDLAEFDITHELSNLESITLKKPNQVYHEIYKQARKKAKLAKKKAILAFLEAKNIKKTYMLDELDDSDSDIELDNLSEYSESELENEL